MGERITFGLVAPEDGPLGERVDALTRGLGERVGVEVVRVHAPSYEALAKSVRDGAVDLAWLPPIVFLRLGDDVVPIGSVRRGGRDSYEAALIVREDSKLRSTASLRGARAGWVDTWSAAGFVVPRVRLALDGVDPRTAFRTERFYGSHVALVVALMDGAVDVAGTYARADDGGQVTSGAWSEVEGADVRVLATFGAIPPDVLATRATLDAPLRDRITGALRDAQADDEVARRLRDVFGGGELVLGLEGGYASLKSALELASARGLFD